MLIRVTRNAPGEFDPERVHIVDHVSEETLYLRGDNGKCIPLPARCAALARKRASSPDPCIPDDLGETVLDYLFDPIYLGAKTTTEAIELRGELRALKHATPDDFANPAKRPVSRIEIWSSSLADPIHQQDAYTLAMKSVDIGDDLRVAFRRTDDGYEEVSFIDCDGTTLPFSPYHDYDRLALERIEQILHSGQSLVCTITDIQIHEGTCAPHDPETTWLVARFIADVFIREEPYE